jgi:hypothetical protein
MFHQIYQPMGTPHVVKLQTGELIALEIISAQDFSILTQDRSCRALTHEVISKSQRVAYMLPNSKVACKGNSSYSLFNSEQEFIKFCADSLSGYSGQEILLGLNKYGVNFPNNTYHLIDYLCSICDCKYSNNKSVDDGLQSVISDVDEAIRNKLTLLQKWECFINFIALIGESVIQDNSAIKWRMQLSDDNKTWNPYLCNGSKEIGIPSLLYRYLIEYETEDVIHECIISVKDILW